MDAVGRDAEYKRLVAQAAGLLDELLELSDMSKADLARSLSCTRGYVTQVFSAKNLTLRTMNDFAFALGHRLRFLPEALESHALPDNVVRFTHVWRDRAVERKWSEGGHEIRLRMLSDPQQPITAPAPPGIDAVAG